MKKRINGREYNTYTANRVSTLDLRGGNACSSNYLRQTLYRKRSGEHFLHSRCMAAGSKPVILREEIIPLTDTQARSWIDNGGAYA